MKILLINYRYFISGGPEKYMFNVTRELEKRGHEVIPFSVRSNKNEPTQYSKYFAEPIGDEDSAYFDEYKKTPRVILQLLKRSFYDKDVERSVKKIIAETNPDVVYVMCYLNKLSPSIIRAAKKMNKKVVVRLSEYGLLCPTNTFLYNNELCEDCVTKGYFSCIRKRCVKNSLPASMIRVASMKYHKMINIYDDVDAFITPSNFLKEKLIQYKFLDGKKPIYHIPTFTFFDENKRPETRQGDYGLYFGRVSPEKGLEYVIRAYEHIGEGFKLRVVGGLDTDEAKRLVQYVEDKGLSNIQFVGFKQGEELLDEIRNARYVFTPSIWYDNFPNVVLESYMNGKPVLASNLGSLPELVVEGQTGMLFEPKNVYDIVRCIKEMEDANILNQMAQSTFDYLVNNYSADIHCEKLLKLLNS